MRPERLTAQQIDMFLSEMPSWHLSTNGMSISLKLKFQSFSQAFSFMTEMALASEMLNHHPEWSNSYRRVSICLTTHDKGGLTDLDTRLAKLMMQSAERFGAEINPDVI